MRAGSESDRISPGGGMVDFSWRISDRTSLEVGYRYLYVDYEKDGFVMDAYNDGIFIGLTWKVR